MASMPLTSNWASLQFFQRRSWDGTIAMSCDVGHAMWQSMLDNFCIFSSYLLLYKIINRNSSSSSSHITSIGICHSDDTLNWREWILGIWITSSANSIFAIRTKKAIVCFTHAVIHTHSYNPFVPNCLLHHNTSHRHLVAARCKFLFEYAGFPRKYLVHNHSNQTNRTTRRPLSRHTNTEKNKTIRFFKIKRLLVDWLLKTF